MKTVSTQFFLLFLCAATVLNAQQKFLPQAGDSGELAQLAGRSIRSGNAVVVVQVNDTLGSSGLNPFKGLFNIGTADDKPLLGFFPQEQYFSHFNVRIDGVVYSNNPNRTGAQALLLRSNPALLPDGTITCSYQASRVIIEQQLTPEQYSPTTGAIRIKYIITNQDAAPHQVGLLLLLDTFVIKTDEARVATRFDYSRIERQYRAPLQIIPDYFQAFENDNPASPGVVAQGTLAGREAVRPDLLIIGNWSTLSSVQWDYTLQNPFYNDSAVLLRWNETPLLQNESRVITTYYGIGDVNIKPGTLALSLTAPNRLEPFASQLSPNPFEINLLVVNTGSAAATGVQATLNLPPGLALASGESASKPIAPADLNASQIGTVSWKVLAQCPAADDSLDFRVDVKSTNSLANSVSRKIFIPSCAAFKLAVSPLSQTVRAGQAATYAINMRPSGGFAGNIRLSLLPAPPSGIMATFSRSNIDANTPATLTLQTAPALSPGNYSFVIVGEGGGLARNEIISLMVQAEPPVDKSPPFTTNHNPARGSRNIPLDTDIKVEVRDADPGVDLTSVTLAVNDTIVTPQISGAPQAYTLRYQPATPFRDNQTVQVRITARDLAILPNIMHDSYVFTTVRDSLPPFTLDHFPARGASQVPVDTKIEVRVRDLLAGVDGNSIVMRINGNSVNPAITGDSREYFLSFQPPTSFRRNDTVRAQIEAGDLASTPNRMAVDRYMFFTQTDIKDTSPPVVVNHAPAPRATAVAPNTTISFELRDDLSGIDSASVVMKVNGATVRPSLQRRPNGYLVSYKPATPFALNDTVRVSVEARDRAAPPNVMPVENFYFVTQRDVIPPFAANHRPAKDATNVPLETDIRVEVRDELAGVDRASLTMQVNGQLVQPAITPILQGFVLQYQPAQNFRYNSTVQVVVRGRDLARPANEMPADTLRFATVRDVEPPFTTDHQPAKSAADAPANTNIVLHARDLIAGVDLASMRMTVNETPVSPTVSGNPQNYKLEYDPPQNFSAGDTVRVSFTAQDLSFPPNVMPRENYFFVVQEQLPDLAATSLRPVGTLFVGLQGEVVGEIMNTGSIEVNRAFNVLFRVDGGTQKDTTFSKLAAGECATLRLPLRFQTTGTHEIELIVDAGDNIREVTEANNSQKLVVQISQAPAIASRLIVRPNPFTPNNDGFNDQVEFDYAGLGLRNPSLQIFDANGIAVWSSNSPAAGRFRWNGRDDRGREVIPGVYLYTLRDQGNNVASGYVVVAR
jgi:spore coat polysaccharide biosynthesis protein SpsF (cytidylyltransferase family)